jgi:hypothetical protein
VRPRAPCRPPGARREVITSSKISSAPVSAVASRRAQRNSDDAGIQPLEPIIGSTITQANSSPAARMASRAASASLYGTRIMSNGAFTGDGAAKYSTPPW